MTWWRWLLVAVAVAILVAWPWIGNEIRLAQSRNECEQSGGVVQPHHHGYDRAWLCNFEPLDRIDEPDFYIVE